MGCFYAGENAPFGNFCQNSKRLPFPLLGIDFDTGGEFVNYHLVRYSERNNITYTRAREEKKNDQNYIEQQNFSVVRACLKTVIPSVAKSDLA